MRQGVNHHWFGKWIIAWSVQSMMTSSNGNFFRVTGPLCGEFTGPGEFPTQRPVTRSFCVFFDLRLNKRLNKQSWGWWFETLSRPFWRHRNGRYLNQHWNIVDLIGTLGTNFNEILIGIHIFSFTKMHLKMSSVKWRSSSLGLNVLMSGCQCVWNQHRRIWGNHVRVGSSYNADRYNTILHIMLQ